MAYNQAKRLSACEVALGMNSIEGQIRELSDMHLNMLVALQAMNEVHGLMDYETLVRRFLTAVRRGRAFTLPGWTPALAEEFETRRRQLQGGAGPGTPHRHADDALLPD